MNNLLDQLSGTSLTLAAAGALALLAYLAGTVITRWMTRHQLRRTFAVLDGAAPQSEAALGSAVYKILSAFAAYGLNVEGREERAFYTAIAFLGVLAGLLLTRLGINLPLALILGLGVGYGLVRSLVNGQWSKTRQQIEAEIPTFLRNLSGIIQTEHNVRQAMLSAAESLDPDKPLAAWVRHCVREWQPGAADSLVLAAYEISPSLGVALFEIARLDETGGQGYAQAFHLTAENLAAVASVRAQAMAKSSGAMGLAKLIIAATVISLGYILNSATGQRIYLASGVMKLAFVAAIAWGIYGWSFIQEMVREATS